MVMDSFISVFSYFCCHRVAAEDEHRLWAASATAQLRGCWGCSASDRAVRRGWGSAGIFWQPHPQSGTAASWASCWSQLGAGCLWDLLVIYGASCPLCGFWCSLPTECLQRHSKKSNAHLGQDGDASGFYSLLKTRRLFSCEIDPCACPSSEASAPGCLCGTFRE